MIAPHHRSLLVSVALFATAVGLRGVLAAPRAPAPAASYQTCSLSQRDQQPGGTQPKPTYNLSLRQRGTTCSTAKRVMRAFGRLPRDRIRALREEGGHALVVHRSQVVERLRDLLRDLHVHMGQARRAGHLPAGRPQAVRPRATLAAAAALALALLLAVTAAAAPATCVGAAARDPHHPCTNQDRTLRLKPGDVGLEPATTDCRMTSQKPAPVCTFGVSARSATATVALVGDSHALHWRAALEIVARARRWRGFSITTAACPFSAIVAYLPEFVRDACVAWYADAQAWFAAHPAVSTAIVSQTTRLDGAAPGRTDAELKRSGYIRAWSSLPRTVTRVIVLRDTPDPADDTFECVDRAQASGVPRLALACPTPRAAALRPDPAVATARALHSRRYRTIDLTSLFCAPRNCYPVIGGLQVYADTLGHITASYMRTVAPYLLRRLGG